MLFLLFNRDNMFDMKQQFTAIYKKDGEWYLGWIEEIPGVNTQGRTLKETKENLKEALWLILETNRIVNKSVGCQIIKEPITLSR